MSNTEKQNTSTTRSVWKGFVKYTDGVLTVAIVQVLVRAAVISPVLLTARTGGKLPAWVGWTAAALLYIFLAMPLRCWGGEKLRRMFYTRHMHSKTPGAYGKWLKAELQRFLRGLFWGLPFLIWFGYCLHYYVTNKALQEIQGFNVMWIPVMNLATLLGQEPDLMLGLAVVFLILLLLGLIFADGWWRYEMLDYLPIRSMELDRCFRWAGRMRRHHRKEVIKNTLGNILLTLPAFVGFMIIFFAYVRSNIDMSRGLIYFFAKLPQLLFDLLDKFIALKNPFPQKFMLLLGALLALVYLPLCVLRKMRIAALAGKLMKSAASSGHHHHHHHEHQEFGELPATGGNQAFSGQQASEGNQEAAGQQEPVERHESDGIHEAVERQESTGENEPAERQESTGQPEPSQQNEIG